MQKIVPKSTKESMDMMKSEVTEKRYPRITIPIEQMPELRGYAPDDMCNVTLQIRVTGVRTGKGEYNNQLEGEIHGYETEDIGKKSNGKKMSRYKPEDNG